MLPISMISIKIFLRVREINLKERVNKKNKFCKMKKGCLSEEIFEVVSNEESHYKRRSFDGKARRISQDDKNTQFCRMF